MCIESAIFDWKDVGDVECVVPRAVAAVEDTEAGICCRDTQTVEPAPLRAAEVVGAAREEQT